METFVRVIHIFTCALLMLLILIQSGKGSEMTSMQSGGSQSIFGSAGGANFFTRLTAIMAFIFMTTSLVLTLMGSQAQKSVFEGPFIPPASTHEK